VTTVDTGTGFEFDVLVDRALDVGRCEFRGRALAWLSAPGVVAMWRMLGEGAYAVAMEPTTNRDAGRFDALERGELRFLDPGESRRYDLEIGALDGADAIAAFDARVRTALHGSPGQVGGRVAG